MSRKNVNTHAYEVRVLRVHAPTAVARIPCIPLILSRSIQA